MKVQTNAKPSSILGGDFIGGEMAWRQGDQIPYQDNNKLLLSLSAFAHTQELVKRIWYKD